MAKHPRKRRARDKRRPEQVRPLDPETFRQAVLRAHAAASTLHPLLHERGTPHLLLRDGN